MELQVEKEQIQLDKEAGNLMETEMGEFLFFGYVDKLNVDITSLPKKLKPRIDLLVKDGDTGGVIREIKKELKTILESVKKAQSADMRKWRRTGHE